jgi:predicted glycoside hydrolase/deacetylase ChbG (UPF0249 family)
MKLIVTADDCGTHPAVARAVKRLAARGLVTSAGLVANGQDIEAAADLKGVALGVHLDVLRGRPVGHWQERATLVDDKGVFFGSAAKLFARYAEGRVEHAHVESEWRAQIERVVALGVRPVYLSSHANVHAWPTLTRIAGDLAAEFGIRWMRTPETCSEISRHDITTSRDKFLNVCGLFNRRTDGVEWPGMVWGLEQTRDGFSPSAFASALDTATDRLPADAVVELCCRPGVTIAGDPPIDDTYEPTVIAGVWQAHAASLSSEDWPGTWNGLGLEVVGFDQA